MLGKFKFGRVSFVFNDCLKKKVQMKVLKNLVTFQPFKNVHKSESNLLGKKIDCSCSFVEKRIPNKNY